MFTGLTTSAVGIRRDWRSLLLWNSISSSYSWIFYDIFSFLYASTSLVGIRGDYWRRVFPWIAYDQLGFR
ncbi:hypothetical protein MIMGU_mgv1a017521mg [Erythranthe guttata]|uniref:Uncharacterized protein n=1 Tax=Erythranthe guttata TaxID=4155 RepID=A0A022RT25_ERYGU|nr:hypothetical protein MIMGU_mgv1a017521mg [Erythranthe guttata]